MEKKSRKKSKKKKDHGSYPNITPWSAEEDENELTVALRLKMQSALYFPRLKIAREAAEHAG